MSSFFKYFKFPLIITVVISVVCFVVYSSLASDIQTERTNEYYDNSVCVFDYADKLTDEEEYELNEMMLYWQEQSCVDMAIYIINEPEYAYLDSVKALADSITHEYQMGFEGPEGSTIVFVDNWSREGDGKIHSWISTLGDRVRHRLSDSECEEILYELDNIPSDDADPFEQYYNIMYKCGKEAAPISAPFGIWVPFLVALIIAAIYIIMNWNSKLGDVAVTNSTYLAGGEASFPTRLDTFRNKVVTKHKIERSSSSGGSGGGSNGGGGHSR